MRYVLLAFLLQAKPPSDADLKRAEAKVAAKEDDPAANLALGKLLAFGRGEWARAMPHLAKGDDAFFKALAEKEIAGGNALDLADSWWTGSTEIEAHLLTGATATAKVQAKREAARLRPFFVERALFWYAKAWPSLEENRRPKILDLARKASAPPQGRSEGGGQPAGWNELRTKESGSRIEGGYAHSGRFSIAIDCSVKAPRANYARLMGTMILIPPGTKEVTLSCWMRSEETEGNRDAIFVGFWTGAMDGLTQIGPEIPGNLPFWTRIERTAQIPERAARMAVFLVADSSKGTLWVDDVSLTAGGKEMLVGGSFDGR